MKSSEMIKFRQNFKMNQTELAKLLGVTGGAVNFWETNQRRIPPPVQKIIRFLNRFPQYKGEM